ncbi:MAG: hypothetical protein AAB116_21635, partial [Candidatus Poribacteria bacterium]
YYAMRCFYGFSGSDEYMEEKDRYAKVGGSFIYSILKWENLCYGWLRWKYWWRYFHGYGI